MSNVIKGRGAQFNPPDPYAKFVQANRLNPDEVSDGAYTRSQYIEVFPKTIVNKVPSPDVGMDYSINPYQGCEHGCVYCYARNTHPYWGYSAGLDFESKILVKKNAPDLLHAHLSKDSWQGETIVLSGNTDCYQPIEHKLKITRALLEVFVSFYHATGIITKNSLVQRDIDLLQQLAKNNLVKVIISVTTLDEDLRRKLEPRTASVKQRLQTMAFLAKEGIPVGVMAAPMIPGLNDHEILEIIRVSSLMGATQAGYTIVRLNGDVAPIFSDWLEKTYPDRAGKVLNKIADCHGGQLNDSRFKLRMRGQGNFAKMIRDQFKLAEEKYMPKRETSMPDRSLYFKHKQPQLKLDFG